MGIFGNAVGSVTESINFAKHAFNRVEVPNFDTVFSNKVSYKFKNSENYSAQSNIAQFWSLAKSPPIHTMVKFLG